MWPLPKISRGNLSLPLPNGPLLLAMEEVYFKSGYQSTAPFV
jgi:hypothetical protein